MRRPFLRFFSRALGLDPEPRGYGSKKIEAPLSTFKWECLPGSKVKPGTADDRRSRLRPRPDKYHHTAQDRRLYRQYCRAHTKQKRNGKADRNRHRRVPFDPPPDRAAFAPVGYWRAKFWVFHKPFVDARRGTRKAKCRQQQERNRRQQR